MDHTYTTVWHGLAVTYTGPAHDLTRLLVEIGHDLAEHGTASPWWFELNPVQRRRLTGLAAQAR